MSDELQQREFYARFSSVHHDLTRLMEDYDSSGFGEPGEMHDLQVAVLKIGHVAMNLGMSFLDGK